MPIRRTNGRLAACSRPPAIWLRHWPRQVTRWRSPPTPPGRRSGAGSNACRLMTRDALDRLRQTRWDAVVSLTAIPGPVRDLVPPGVPAFLWTGHAEDQPAVQCLSDPAVRNGWDAVVLVSEWQRARYAERFGLPDERSAVLRNAIAPAFENLFPDKESLARAKQADPLLLAYTSTPFRGLELLASMFPLIPRPARLRIFSDMGTYLTGPADSQFQALYERCREHPRYRACRDPVPARAGGSVARRIHPGISLHLPRNRLHRGAGSDGGGLRDRLQRFGRSGGDDGRPCPAGRSGGGLEQLRRPLSDGARSRHGVRAVTARHQPPVEAGALRQRDGNLGKRAGEWFDFFKKRIA